MNQATFRFHGELNDFLPRSRRESLIHHAFDWRASIKDMIESLGVPHAEIELLVVDGVCVDFYYIVAPGVHVDVYDSFDSAEVPGKIRLRPVLNGRTAFVLDTHLGRLASYLRMMGFDTLYRNDYPDDELAEISSAQDRVLLTRDIGLLKRSIVRYGRFVRHTDPRLQLAEIVRRYSLLDAVVPFRRCLKCNGLLTRVDKDAVRERLRADTAAYYDEFHRCPDCDQVYWKGSHYERMRQFVAQMLNAG